MSLTGKRILITRTRRQASELATQLEALGAIPILIPTIEIVPPASFAALDAAITRLSTLGDKRFDWLLFTSANAVEAFHSRLTLQATAPSDAPSPGSQTLASAVLQSSLQTNSFPGDSSLKIAAIGPATAKAVQQIGLTPQIDLALIPPQYTSESLAESLLPEAPGKSFLLVRAAEARDVLPEILTAAGAAVTIAEAYRNQIPAGSIPALQQLFALPENHPDAITFTSASTARNLFALLEATGITLPTHIALASIGPITTQTLRDLCHEPTIEARIATIESLVQSLLVHFG